MPFKGRVSLIKRRLENTDRSLVKRTLSLYGLHWNSFDYSNVSCDQLSLSPLFSSFVSPLCTSRTLCPSTSLLLDRVKTDHKVKGECSGLRVDLIFGLIFRLGRPYVGPLGSSWIREGSKLCHHNNYSDSFGSRKSFCI